MHLYRTHLCGALRLEHEGQTVRLSGWIDRKRDHGNLLFVDLRDYGMGAQILYDLGVRKIRLMTNNPRKVVGLDGHRLEIVEKVPIMTVPNEHNERYLGTKRDKLGHFL